MLRMALYVVVTFVRQYYPEVRTGSIPIILSIIRLIVYRLRCSVVYYSTQLNGSNCIYTVLLYRQLLQMPTICRVRGRSYVHLYYSISRSRCPSPYASPPKRHRYASLAVARKPPTPPSRYRLMYVMTFAHMSSCPSQNPVVLLPFSPSTTPSTVPPLVPAIYGTPETQTTESSPISAITISRMISTTTVPFSDYINRIPRHQLNRRPSLSGLQNNLL